MSTPTKRITVNADGYNKTIEHRNAGLRKL
jgi:hypothetical protein